MDGPGRSGERASELDTRARARAPAFITDTNLILRFIIESMTIIVPTGIP